MMASEYSFFPDNVYSCLKNIYRNMRAQKKREPFLSWHVVTLACFLRLAPVKDKNFITKLDVILHFYSVFNNLTLKTMA